MRKNHQHNNAASSSLDSERQSKLGDAWKMSHEVSVESLRLSKLGSAFEESLRISKDSDKSEKSSRSPVDFERPNRPPDTAEKSLDVSVMERCLAAMTQSNSRPSQEEEEEGLVSRPLANEDGDDDDDCSSLLASLSDLESQLQQEIKQTQRHLHDKHTTSDQVNFRGVESTSHKSRESVEQGRESVRETTGSCVPVNHALSATTTCTATTTATTTTTGYC